VKAYERLTVRAAVEGSYDTALRALLAHLLVGSYPSATAILDEYVAAHPGLLDGVRPLAAEIRPLQTGLRPGPGIRFPRL
jgi:hypothetical protein